MFWFALKLTERPLVRRVTTAMHRSLPQVEVPIALVTTINKSRNNNRGAGEIESSIQMSHVIVHSPEIMTSAGSRVLNM